MVTYWNGQRNVSGSFTVGKDMLTAGHTYRIEASMSRDGYEGSDDNVEVFVLDAPSEGNNLLSVENGTGDLSEWPINKELPVTVQAEGSSAVRIWNNGGWDYYSSYEYDNNGNMVRYRIISKEESNMNTMNMGI